MDDEIIICANEFCDEVAGVYYCGPLNARKIQKKFCSEKCKDYVHAAKAKANSIIWAKQRAEAGEIKYKTNTRKEADAKKERGERADWHKNGDETEAWVESELAKIDIDDRITFSRCPTCAARIREFMQVRDDGKVYCSDGCYSVRLTDEMVNRHPDREPALYAQLLRKEGKDARS
jgi:ribosomal protein L24E